MTAQKLRNLCEITLRTQDLQPFCNRCTKAAQSVCKSLYGRSAIDLKLLRVFAMQSQRSRCAIDLQSLRDNCCAIDS
jgi:hypothetical protein